jgi:hypothetical protein
MISTTLTIAIAGASLIAAAVIHWQRTAEKMRDMLAEVRPGNHLEQVPAGRDANWDELVAAIRDQR